MKIHQILKATISHSLVMVIGFVLGVYTLPILIAPPAASDNHVQLIAQSNSYQGQFERERQDSDWLHWATGRLTLGEKNHHLSRGNGTRPRLPLVLVA